MTPPAEMNRQVVEGIFTELSKGNSRPFLDVLADDVRWTVAGTTGWSGTYRGKQAVLSELLGPLFSRFGSRYTCDADRFIADAEHVVVEARGHAITKSGVPFDNTYCYVFRLAEGEVHEVTEYCDTQLVVEALGNPDGGAR